MKLSELFKKFDINKTSYGSVIRMLIFLRANPTILNNVLKGIGENKMTKNDLRKIIREEIINIINEVKVGDNVKLVYKGVYASDPWAKYFNGITGRVQGIEKDGSTKMYRIVLDTTINIPGFGKVSSDLWSGEFIKKIGK